MKLKTFVSGLTIATAAAIVAAPSQAEVTYSGDPDSVAVCRAIIDDSSSDLKQAIRRAAPRHQKTNPVSALQDNFECNGSSLEDFAIEVGSYEALNLLSGKVDGQVAAR